MMPFGEAAVGRRALLTGAGLIGAALLLPGRARAQGTASDLAAYLRLRFGRPGRPVWYQYEGTVFAMPLGRRAVPMFRVVGISRNASRPLGPDRHEATLDEAGWYCDPATGEPIDSLESPINGKRIGVKHYRSPQRAILTPGRYAPAEAPPPGVEFDGRLSPLARLNDAVWLSEDIFARTAAKPAPEALAANPAAAWRAQTSLATWRARAADFDRRGLAEVPAALSYQTLANWRSWFEADDVPGVMSWRLNGVKLFDAAAASGRAAELVRRHHPDLLAS